MIDASTAISEITKIQDYDKLTARAEELLDDIDISDDVLKAIEKRQDELYVLTAKDIAEKALNKGIDKQAENIRKNRKSAIIRQHKINQQLKVAFNDAS